ncbi:VOC family protein [Pseudonocardia sp. GCM10023141]|uniref:VOC family protein n=1 Tax=Pseudonocardia sp. GCM10023141 TaxID=3252653 RepID=UPI00360D4E83
MTDPFDALRAPVRPVDPDPAFAAALRSRIERALLDPQEPAMTTTTDRPTTLAPVRLHALTPYLAVTDARAAVAFYVEVFGATRRGEPIVMPDGRVGHVEVTLGDSVLMLADEYPEIGLVAPVGRGGPSQSLRLEVSDPDAVVARAVAAGAVLDRPVTDSPDGRGGSVLDPSGHRWMIAREPATSRAGDIGYASLWRPDVVVAERFYHSVFGWTVESAGHPQGRRVTGLRTHLGMFGGQQQPSLFPCFAVPDVDVAVVLVRAAGGTAEDPVTEEFGRVAGCVDDQGLQFAMYSAPAASMTAGGDAAEIVPGAVELDYAELRVPDATRARAFYGTVLGWRFVPGADPGYWHMEVAAGGHTRPMTGLAGGHDEPSVLPTFTVPDLEAAVAAVRVAGGTATDPAGTRHGTSAACTDDQGAPFLLLPSRGWST